MHDAVYKFDAPPAIAYEEGELANVFYQMTRNFSPLRIVTCPSSFLESPDAGKLCSTELHWDKFQLLSVQCTACVCTPSGEHIESTPGAKYLGAVVTHTGLPGHELGRRIGKAKADFTDSQRIWKHYEAYEAFFISCLSSEGSYLQNCGCMHTDVRLELFLSFCSRTSTLGWFPKPMSLSWHWHSTFFLSRVPSKDVLHRARCNAVSDMLVQRQLLLFGNVSRSPLDHPLYASANLLQACEESRPTETGMGF